eukprot:tig00000057_g112.t1
MPSNATTDAARGAAAAPEIKPIDSSSRHRICSGQVILDLATAVKELVENAADAGATSIEVRLKDYGADQFEVADNGSGVDPANYKSLALKHWTSKIRRFEDLESVASFGFRGEALSSLCAMSTLVVTTRTAGHEIGARIEFEQSGNVAKQSPAAREVGTTVTVSGIFKNMPVRAEKFKKEIKKEYSHMLSVLQGYAVVLSGVRITVSNQPGKGARQVVLSSPGGTLRENVASVFGSKQLACMDDFNAEDGAGPDGGAGEQAVPLRIAGLVSKAAPGSGRGSGDRQYLFLNGRPVEVPKISKAMNEVYKSYNSQQYPAFFLDIRMDRGAYDVNVVPDKRKVMFHDLDRILSILRSGMASLYDPSRGYDVNDAARPGGGSLVSSSRASGAAGGAGGAHLLRLEAGPASAADGAALLSPPSSAPRPAALPPSAPPSSSSSRAARSPPEEASSSSPRTPAGPASGSTPRTTGRRGTGAVDPKAGGNPFAGKAFVPKHMRAAAGSGSQTVDLTADEGEEEAGEADAEAEAADAKGPEGSPPKDARVRCDWDSVAAGVSPKQRAAATAAAEGEAEAEAEAAEGAEGRPAPKRRRKAASGPAGPPVPGLTPGIAVRVQCDWAAMADDVPWDPEAPAPVAAAAAVPPAGLFSGAEGDEEGAPPSPSEGPGLKSFAGYEAEGAARRMERVIEKEHFGQMRVIGQFNAGFIIAQLGSDLFIIDQHASDEKYRFETLRRTTSLHVQPLIRPLPVEMTAAEEVIVAEHRDAFVKNGFELEFDEEAPPGRRVRLKARPQSKDVTFGPDDVLEIVAALREGVEPGAVPRPSRVRAMLASRACRSAIMIGDPLAVPEMTRVVRNMGTMDQPWNCPHGRPTMRHLVDLSALPRL